MLLIAQDNEFLESLLLIKQLKANKIIELGQRTASNLKEITSAILCNLVGPLILHLGIQSIYNKYVANE